MLTCFRSPLLVPLLAGIGVCCLGFGAGASGALELPLQTGSAPTSEVSEAAPDADKSATAGEHPAPGTDLLERYFGAPAPFAIEGLLVASPVLEVDLERLSARRAQAALESLGLSIERWIEAGEPVPPALPAERAAGRRSAQLAAIAQLGEAFAAARPEQVDQAFEACWSAGRSDERLSRATARLIGHFDRAVSLPCLATELERAPLGRRAAAARRALQDMFGLWFAEAAELRPFLDGRDAVQREPYREFARRLYADRTVLWQSLWAAYPLRAMEALRDPSPRLRADAARVLNDWGKRGGAVAEGAPEGLRALLEALTREGDEAAFAAELEAAQALWSGLPADSEAIQVARVLLESACRSASPGVLHCLARAVISMPEEQPLPDAMASSSWAAVRLVELFGRIERSRAPDPDVTVALIETQRQWARSHQELRSGQESPWAAPLLALLSDRRAAPSVRLAAAAAMRDLAQPRDLGPLIEALALAPDEPGLRFALLQVLDRLAGQAELGVESAAALCRTALELLGDQDVDVRERALALLFHERVSAQLTEADLERLLAQLDGEVETDLCAGLVQLIASRGSRAAGLGLLAPRVLGLISAEGERNEVRTLDLVHGALAIGLADDPVARLRAAERLMTLATGAVRPRCAVRALALAAPADSVGIEALAEALGDPGFNFLGELIEWSVALAQLKLDRRLLLERQRAEQLLELSYDLFLPEACERGVYLDSLCRSSKAELALAIDRLPVAEVLAAVEAGKGLQGPFEVARLDICAARFLQARGELRAAFEGYARLLDGPDGSPSPDATPDRDPDATGPGATPTESLDGSASLKPQAALFAEAAVGSFTAEDWRAVLSLSQSVGASEFDAERALSIGRRAAEALLTRPDWSLADGAQMLIDLERANDAMVAATDDQAAGRLAQRIQTVLVEEAAPTEAVPLKLLAAENARSRLEALLVRLSAVQVPAPALPLEPDGLAEEQPPPSPVPDPSTPPSGEPSEEPPVSDNAPGAASGSGQEV